MIAIIDYGRGNLFSLISALNDDDYDEISKSAIYSSLFKIKSFTKVSYGNTTTKVHYNFLNWKVSKALDDSDSFFGRSFCNFGVILQNVDKNHCSWPFQAVLDAFPSSAHRNQSK